METPIELQLAFLNWQAEEEIARERAVVKARQYDDGDHPTYITARMKEFLGTDAAFRLNISRTVVAAVSERLLVAGFSAAGAEAKSADGKTVNPLADWAWQVWLANKMDARQDDVQHGALRDGEYFVIVDYSDEMKAPRLIPHERYTDAMNVTGGNGFGVKMFYPDDDINQPPLYATKRWTESLGQGKARQRLTVYYPERVEKYAMDGGKWQLLADGDTPNPLPWVDAQGKPLGIPVIHFRNKGLRCEAWDAYPLQDAVNKALIDLIAAGDQTAFRILIALGFIPTTDGNAPKSDGSNWLKIAPGQVIYTTKTRAEADFTAIEPADLTQLREMKNDLILDVARVTDTPPSRFRSTKAVAAEGTQQEEMEPLLAKVRNRQTLFGDAWEECLAMARRLANHFGGAGLDEEIAFETIWAPSSARDDLKIASTIALKREKLGVPLEQCWRELGYTDAQIEQMKGTDEYRARMAMLKTGLSVQG